MIVFETPGSREDMARIAELAKVRETGVKVCAGCAVLSLPGIKLLGPGRREDEVDNWLPFDVNPDKLSDG